MPSYADRVMARLRAWPSVSAAQADCGIGLGLGVGAYQVLHLHSAGEAELLLTRPVIGRLREVLVESGRVAVQPGGDWVRVTLNTDSDVTLVISLVSVALKAAGDAFGTSQKMPCGAAERPSAGHPVSWSGRATGPVTLSGNGPRTP